jgi:hypothetical protein
MTHYACTVTDKGKKLGLTVQPDPLDKLAGFLFSAVSCSPSLVLASSPKFLVRNIITATTKFHKLV